MVGVMQQLTLRCVHVVEAVLTNDASAEKLDLNVLQSVIQIQHVVKINSRDMLCVC